MAQVDRGDQQYRKSDTQLLVDWNTNPATDLGNLATDLSTGFAVAYELNSARTALTTREISVRFDADNTNAGYLINHGNTADTSYGFRIQIDGSGNIICEDDTNGEIFNVALPGVSGSTQTFVAQWCTRENALLTSGASDAYRSELWLHNDDAGTFAVYQATHAIPPVDATEELALGGHYDGAAPSNAYDGSPGWFRVGKRFHSTEEAAIEWAGVSYTPSNTGQSYVSAHQLPTRVGTEDQFAGPALLYADIAHTRNAMRNQSPLVNDIYRDPVTLTDDILDDVHDGLVLEIETGWQAHLGMARYRPMSPVGNKVTTRVNIQLWDNSSFPGSPDQVEVRVYSANYHPAGPKPPNPKIDYVTLTRTTDDGPDGPGDWHEDELTINRDADGWTWLWHAYRVNEGSASANTRYKIWAWIADPISTAVSDSEDHPGLELPGG
jgi:hypothetical protein